MRDYEAMDRNLSNEPGYRPKGDSSVPPMASAEPDYFGSGVRQVLARMPNLAQVDPDVDPIQSYPSPPENRVLSSGVSVKLLAGGAVCLALLAALGFSFFTRKPASEPSNVSPAWQAAAPAPGAEQGPWSGAPAWGAQSGSNANPWGSPASPGNPPANSSAGNLAGSPTGNPAGFTNPSAAAAAPLGNAPTELTASASNLPVWGQVQEPNSPAPSNANANNSPSTPWSPPPSMTMPSTTPPAWANPTPIATAPAPANAASGYGYSNPAPGAAVNYNGAYQPAQASPAFAAPYNQPAVGANTVGANTANGNLPNGNLNGAASPWGAAAPTSPVASDPRTPAWPDATGNLRNNTAAPYDARGGFNSSATGQAQYPNVPSTQMPLPPSASTNGSNYATADTRTNVGGSYGTALPSPANNGSFAGGYPAGAVAARSNYPNPSQMPATAGNLPGNNPSMNSPAGGYPAANPTPSNYPANSYMAPNSASPPPTAWSYPGAAAPVGAPPLPRYDSGASTVAPQTGAQQEGYLR